MTKDPYLQALEEKRRHPRIGGATVEYFLEGKDPDKKKNAFIKDISLDGICLFIAEAVDDKAVFCMDIYLFGDTASVKARGDLVWQKKGEHLKLHAVGIEFAELDGQGRKKLDEQL